MANQSGSHIFTVSLIAAAILWLVTGSEPLEPGPINIGRWQYERALAKWNRMRIEEYELIVRDFAKCRHKLVVGVDRSTGEAVEDIKHIEEFGCIPPDNPDLASLFSVEELTVGGLFIGTDSLLKLASDPLIDGGIYRGTAYIMIRFDPKLGHPRSIAYYGDYDDLVLIVESVKILK